MIGQKSLSITLFSVGLFLSFLPIGNFPIHGQEISEAITSNKTSLSLSTVVVRFKPPNPPTHPTPTNTVGGGTRSGGACSQDTAPLGPSITPLMPATRQGLTVTENPTFFVYIPQTSAQKALFAIKDDKEDYYYQKIVSIPRTAGIVSFKLPADAPALEIGKSYQWAFIMICGEGIRPDSPMVQGRIERIATNPVVSSNLNTLLPLERAALYGKDGIWYDTLTTLAELKRSQPNNSDFAANWQELLTSVGLESIATKPLLN